MAKVLPLLMFVMVFHTTSNAAPKENARPIITTSGERHKIITDTYGQAERTNIDNEASQSHRQTRFYDSDIDLSYSPFSFPPGFPYSYYPSYSKRDEPQDTGGYGTQDALSVIFKRLQEIIRGVRQSVSHSTKTPVPAYIPVVYIPQVGCGCIPNEGASRPGQEVKPSTTNTGETMNNNGSTSVNTNKNVTLEDRFPVIDDNRQNWGILVNSTDTDDVIEGDGSRPISLEPIPPSDPQDVPAPPVEHGTIQAGAEPERKPNEGPKTTTSRPLQPPITAPPASNYIPPANDDSENLVPTLCDGAIISCCNQPRISIKCFESQGCANPTLYGKPCDPEVQIMLINKFKYFQQRRIG